MNLFKKMKNENGRKGFTLAEMLIVIALLAIVMSFAVPGVASYVKRLKLMELDDSARAVFMAVQNKMTVMKQSGADLDLTGSEEMGTPAVPLPISFESGEAPAEPEEDVVYVDSKIRFIRSNDLKSLITAGNEGFVNLSSIEGQLYNHNYVIEYDAVTGRVFGVFYSEESDLSDYPDTTNPDLYDRDFEDRLKADKLVGYYGGGTVSRFEFPKGGEDEPLYDVKDSTLEKLVFMLDPPKNADGTYDTGKYYFEVKITGKDAFGKDHTVTIVPYDAANPDNNYYVENGQRGTVILDSIAPGCGADKGKWDLPASKNMSGYTLERDFKGWVYIKDQNFVDSNGNPIAGAPSEYDPYIHSLSSWNLGKDYVVQSGLNPNQTGMYFYINPGSDIEVSVKRCKAGGDGLLESLPNTSKVNSYFDSIDGNCAVIKAGRHLQNLANYVDRTVVTSVRLEKDIDFSLNTGDYDSWNSPVTYRGNADYPYLYNFKPIFSQFVDTSNFSQNFDGNGKVIKYIRIDTVNDPRFKDDDVVRNNTSFFVRLYNTTANNVEFYCPVVIGGGDYTGLFFGQCTGGTNIQNYTVVNPIVESSGKYVGGLFGEIQGGGEISGHRVYVEEVADYFDNYNIDYTRADDARVDIKWGDPENDPYSKFRVKGLGYDTYAGGIIGHTISHLKSSSAAIRVESNGYAGGLVGFAEGDISKCYVGGHTHNGSFVLPGGKYLVNIDGKLGAGGLAGRMTTGGIDGCYTTCSVRKYAGRDTYDTFVGSLSGKSGSNGAYAIGSLIDVENGIVTNQGSICSGVITDIELIKNEGDVAVSYDPALKGEKYPYDNGASTIKPHYGDWPAKEPVFGAFYWEKNSDGESAVWVRYYKKGVLQEDISTLCTERDSKAVTEHGYGYFYTKHKDGDSTVNNPTITVTGDLEGQGMDSNDGKNLLALAGITGVEVEAKKTNTSVSGASDRELRFEYNDGTAPKTEIITYQPYLCALGDVGMTEYQVRSAAQLQGLSTIAEYSSCSGKSYVMSHDIVFGTDSLKPIGTSGMPFEGTFDGKCYRIVDARLDANNLAEAGVFGAVKNADIKSVVVFNADFSGINLSGSGAMGGIVGRALGNSSITNCAFAGKIGVMTSGVDLAAGGIVGIVNGGTLQNCEAVMHDPAADASNPDMSVTAHGGVVAAGGIAGLVYNAPISNCYSGGAISVSGGADNYVGGIIGANGSETVNLTINSCYTYYQAQASGDSTFAHPIGSKKQGAAADVYYTNCHYLGGAWYVQEDPNNIGVMRYDDPNAFKGGTSGLISSGFATADEAYIDNLTAPMEFSLPAVITDAEKYYHYGKSPFTEQPKPISIDKSFGVFYWEKEGEKYSVKVCYYDSDGNYAGEIDKLCRKKDGASVTQSGYGYFVGKESKKATVLGFEGAAEISNWHINSAVKEACGLESSELYIKCYDYTNSDIADERIVNISSDDVSISGKKFKIVPGLFAIGKADDALTLEVRTQHQLENVSRNLSGTFTQSHDIVCGSSIAPIGDALNPFRGKYHGEGYRISKLTVSSSGENVGLFARTSGAAIDGVVVVDGNISRNFGDGSANVGGIVGSAENNTTIENCAYTGVLNVSVKGDVKGRTGGIAGCISGGSSISHCEAAADITASDIGISGSGYIAVGGLVGGSAGGIVENSYSGGSFKQGQALSKAYISGIVGYSDENSNLTVRNCYTHMNIPAVADGMVVHPIAQTEDTNGINIFNCHYLESKNHFANDIDLKSESNITKYDTRDDFVNGLMTGLGSSGFGAASHTYRVGMAESEAYPFPAVVKNGDELVHYGNWNENAVKLSPDTYGMFYWEKEGDKYSVKAYYASNGKTEQGSSLCSDADNKAITDYGYGYFTSRSAMVDRIEGFDGNEANVNKKLSAALSNIGIKNVALAWKSSTAGENEDTVVEFKYKNEQLMCNGSAFKVRYNGGFCALSNGSGELIYEVRTAAQFDNVRHCPDKSFKQTHDIVFGDNVTLEPIGTADAPFTGSYDGKGYRIVKLKISTDNESFVGLFGAAKGAELKGIVVFNGEIKADNITDYTENPDYIGGVGGIVGYADNDGKKDTTVNGCAFTGRINASPKSLESADHTRKFGIGGIVGCARPYTADTSAIKNCEAAADISWNGDNQRGSDIAALGGIVGSTSGKVEYCYSGGKLSADNVSGNVKDCYIGGIVGNNATFGTAAKEADVNVDSCYTYISLKADGDKVHKNPIGQQYGSNNFEIKNSFYLKGEDYYSEDVETEGVTAAATLAELQTALKELKGFAADKQYLAAAYPNSLSGRSIYGLAAVVKDKNGSYVHYGKMPIDDGTIEGLEPPKTYYKITVADNIQHGTVTADVNETAAGDTVTVTVKADEGYKLNWINLDSTQNNQIDQNTYAFTMPERDVKISAEFGKIDTGSIHNITVNINGEGTVECPEQAERYTQVTMITKPANGWKVKSIEGIDYWGDNNNYKFNMPDDDVTITVTFEEDNSTPEGIHNVTVNVVGEGKVIYDKQVERWQNTSITAIPADGWVFDKIEGVDYWNSGENQYSFNMPDNDVTLTVIFKKQ